MCIGERLVRENRVDIHLLLVFTFKFKLSLYLVVVVVLKQHAFNTLCFGCAAPFVHGISSSRITLFSLLFSPFE